MAVVTRIPGQKAKGTSTTTSVSATYPGATTPGNLLLVDLYSITAAATVTGPAGFTAVATRDFSAGAQTIIVFAKIADGTESVISASATGSTQMRLHLYEYSGMANPYATDGSNPVDSGVVSQTSINGGNVTTTAPSDLYHIVLGTGGNTTGHAATGTFIIQQTDAANIRLVSGDDITNKAGTTSGAAFTWTTSVRAAMITITFKSALSKLTGLSSITGVSTLQF